MNSVRVVRRVLSPVLLSCQLNEEGARQPEAREIDRKLVGTGTKGTTLSQRLVCRGPGNNLGNKKPRLPVISAARSRPVNQPKIREE